MTDDPMLSAANELLGRLLDSLLEQLDGLDAAQLNWSPAQDANSMAVITTHALASSRSWLSLAVGAELPPRDRPAEFATTVSDAAAFHATVASMVDACRSLLANASSFDPGLVGYAKWTSQPDEPVTAAYSLLHALEHLAEHVGHAELTRQLISGA